MQLNKATYVSTRDARANVHVWAGLADSAKSNLGCGYVTSAVTRKLDEDKRPLTRLLHQVREIQLAEKQKKRKSS